MKTWKELPFKYVRLSTIKCFKNWNSTFITLIFYPLLTLWSPFCFLDIYFCCHFDTPSICPILSGLLITFSNLLCGSRTMEMVSVFVVISQLNLEYSIPGPFMPGSDTFSSNVYEQSNKITVKCSLAVKPFTPIKDHSTRYLDSMIFTKCTLCTFAMPKSRFGRNKDRNKPNSTLHLGLMVYWFLLVFLKKQLQKG